jgi:small GTP-binding protein
VSDITTPPSLLQPKEVDQALQKKYDQARLDERDVLTHLVETLTKVDNLPEDQLDQVRDALFHANYPFLIAMVGPFSAGKSSIVNALLGKAILNVGPVPTTDHIHLLRYGEEEQTSRVGETTTLFYPHPLLQNVSFVDTPGLESVFEKHDSITRKFLHRADLVFLVMVATHVLSASNLDFFKELKTYGKRTIIIINQIDLLEDSERQTVRQFVAEQSRLHMGFEPTIWMVSAKAGLDAQQQTPRDEILYDDSGMAEVEEFIIETLNDEARIRQKLETSLQIANNVRGKAAILIQETQSALTEHQKTLQNIQAQVGDATAAQQKTVQEGLRDIDGLWIEAAQRGDKAIGELFQFSRGFGQAISGMGEMFGIGAILRRFGQRTRAQAAFENHEVAQALNKIPEAVNRLGARLEGRDLQDLDDLVNYTKKQIDLLPPNLQSKVIGRVQTPMSYERNFIRRRQNDLETFLNEGGRFEIANVDKQLQNMLVALGIWSFVVIVIMVIGVIVSLTPTLNAASLGIVVVGGLALLMFGVILLPLRGWILRRAYKKHMGDLKDRYLKILAEVLEEAVKYGGQLRQDTAGPYTRLIEAQTRTVDELKSSLATAEQGIQRILRGIATL